MESKRWDHMKVSMGDSEREFDRWLNKERAKAWDEAITFFETNIYGEATSASEYNPYRKAD